MQLARIQPPDQVRWGISSPRGINTQNFAESGAARKYQDMGAQTTNQAKARAYRYVYKTLGVEMMRSAALLRVNRLGTVLAKSETLAAAEARRVDPVPAWFNTRQEYFDRHSFSMSVHDRPW